MNPLSSLLLLNLCRGHRELELSWLVYRVWGWHSRWLSSLSLFSREPLHSIAESHVVGYNAGRRTGDVLWETTNYFFYLQMLYFSGQSLSNVHEKARELVLQLSQRKLGFNKKGAYLLYLQSGLLSEGLEFNAEPEVRMQLPTWDQILTTRAEALQYSECWTLLDSWS